jgi:hypothetical protein
MGLETMQILDAVKRLPFQEKLHVIELIFREMRTEASQVADENGARRKAAELLLADYQNNEELTSFTVLDHEDFYEAK